MQYKDIKLNAQLLKNIDTLGYETLTEIQEVAIPIVINGKNVLGIAQTGTGKTAAFLLPILENLLKDTSYNSKSPRVLIVAPTRDLIQQIFDNFINYSKGTGIKGICVFGGSGYDKQLKSIRDGVDIIFANTGRLMDLAFKKRVLDLNEVKILVLDEADQMLDMGFAQDITKLITKLPNRQQSLLFSATMPTSIKNLIKHVFNDDYETVKVEANFNINDMVKQKAYLVSRNNKAKLLLEILSQTGSNQCIIFTRTRAEAKALHGLLRHGGYNVDALHSDRTQSSRAYALKGFRAKDIQILVATNVASRGIDVSDLPLVINYNLPEQREVYVHRIGRTGRAGKTGEAISLCSPAELKFLRDIEKIIKMQIDIIKEDKWLERNEDSLSSFTQPRGERSFGGSGSRGRSSSGGSGGSRGGRSFGGSSEGGFRPRRNDDRGGGRSFDGSSEGGFRPRRNDDRDSGRSFGGSSEGSFRPRSNDDRGSGRSFGGSSEGSFRPRRNDDRGERRSSSEGSFRPRRNDDRDSGRSFGGSSEGGFRPRRNDDRGERRGPSFSESAAGGNFRSRSNDDRGSEKRDFKKKTSSPNFKGKSDNFSSARPSKKSF